MAPKMHGRAAKCAKKRAGERPKASLRKQRVPSGARRSRVVHVHVRYRRSPGWRRPPGSGGTRSLRHSARRLPNALSQTSGRQNTPKMYNRMRTHRRNVQFGGSTRLGTTIWSPSRLICTGNVLSGRHSPLKRVFRCARHAHVLLYKEIWVFKTVSSFKHLDICMSDFHLEMHLH